jgi:hypothetical protein
MEPIDGIKDRVAVYWDFENIHISLLNLQYGTEWASQNKRAAQPELVNVEHIMEYVSSLGDVNINKAYANWTILQNYSIPLQTYAVDLIQLFPRNFFSGKNGSDIRLSIDVIEVLSHSEWVGVR